jgi:hypothetical protein
MVDPPRRALGQTPPPRGGSFGSKSRTQVIDAYASFVEIMIRCAAAAMTHPKRQTAYWQVQTYLPLVV